MHPILLNTNISVSGLNSVSLATNSGALVFYTTQDGTVEYICKDITNHRGVNMTPPSTLGKCRQVVTGYRSAVALQVDGTVVGWGDDGNTNKASTEYFMTQLNATGKTVVKLAAGAYHYLALLNDGSVVTWGSGNETAQFSDPNTVWSPVGLIPRPTAAEAPYITGYSAYTNWEYKQDAASFLEFLSSPNTCVPSPELIPYRLFRGLAVGCPLHNGENYSSINPAGGYDTPYIRTSGVYSGTYPRAGTAFPWSGILNWVNDTGAPYDYQFSRATVGDPTSVNYSGPGSSWTKSTAHITMPNGCYNNNCSSPNSIFGTSGKRYIDIAAGRGHSILLTEDGNIETWGQNWYYTITGSGKQGNGWSRAGTGLPNGLNDGTNGGWGAAYPFPPAPIGDQTASTVKSFKTTTGSVKAVGAGYYTSQVIKSDGSIFAWDRNEWGESTPLRNSEGSLGLPTGSFRQIAGGYHHTVALRENGTVVCWGENNSGECNVPFGLSNCIQVIAGSRYTAALRNDGLLFFWGKVDDFGSGYTSVTDVTMLKSTDLFVSISGPISSLILPTYNIYISGVTGNDAWSGEYPGISGTQGPVKTLYRAAEISKSKNNFYVNVDINMRGGVYSIKGTTSSPIFYLDYTSNSSIDKIITYKPYNNESVIISGANDISYTSFNTVTAGNPVWGRLKVSARGNVYEADVSSFDLGTIPDNWGGDNVSSENGRVADLPGIPDLIFNDETMTLARWPNKTTSGPSDYNEYSVISSVIQSGSSTTYPTTRVNGIFTYPSSYDSVISGWTGSALTNGIWLYGNWRWDWSSDVFKLLSIDTINRQLTVRSNQSSYSLQNYTLCSQPNGTFEANPTPRRWYAFNILEELDSAKEYYIDRTTKKLYFWPPSAINSSSSIKLTHRAVAGPSPWAGSEFTTTNGNTAEYGFATNGQPSTTGTGVFPYIGWTGPDIQGVGYTATGPLLSRYAQNTKNVLSSLFKFYKVKNVTIDGLTFTQSAGSGIELSLCQNVTIQNCHIYNIKKHGINASGGRNVTIDSCKIHDIGLKGIINTGGDRQNLIAGNNTVTRCSIKRWSLNMPVKQHAAINMNGVGNIASYNLIADGPLGINWWGNNHVIEYNHFYNTVGECDDLGTVYSGRNMSHFGKTIRYNFFNQNYSKLPGGPLYLNSPIPGCCSA